MYMYGDCKFVVIVYKLDINKKSFIVHFLKVGSTLGFALTNGHTVKVCKIILFSFCQNLLFYTIQHSSIFVFENSSNKLWGSLSGKQEASDGTRLRFWE